MRTAFFIFLLATMTGGAFADEIDGVVTNLPNMWHNGMSVPVRLPETASVAEVLPKVLRVWHLSDKPITNFTIITNRTVNIPRYYFPGALSDSYTATLVQTDVGRMLAIFRYETGGWWSRVYPVPSDFSGIPDAGDLIYNWLDRPARRNPQLHLVLVQIVSITNEHHRYTEATNSKVSDDGGKTWYNHLSVWSGVATVKIIESPGVTMPASLALPFERSHYVHTQDETWQDWLVKPGARLLGFFRIANSEWVLDSGFIDPAGYLLDRSYGKRLQDLFTIPLLDEATLAERKRMFDEASERARQRAGTNATGGNTNK